VTPSPWLPGNLRFVRRFTECLNSRNERDFIRQADAAVTACRSPRRAMKRAA